MRRIVRGWRPWTAEEIETAARMWRELVTEARGRAIEAEHTIARALDRSVSSIQNRRNNYGISFAGPHSNVSIRGSNSSGPPAHVLAQREARAEAAMRRTQTQEFFGDPPPGYSALDRKQQAQRG